MVGMPSDSADEIERLGLSINEIDAQKVENAEDAMSRIGTVMEGVAQSLAVEFAPLIERVAEAFMEWRQETVDTQSVVASFVDRSVNGLGAVLDAVHLIRRGFELVSIAGDQSRVAIQRGAVVMAEALMSFPVRALNELVKMFNNTAARIPGIGEIDIVGPPKFVETMRESIDDLEGDLERNRERTEEIMNEPLPSEALRGWVDEARRAAHESAEIVVEGRESELTAHYEADDKDRDRRQDNEDEKEEERQKEREREREHAKELARIQERLDDKLERLQREKARKREEVLNDTLSRMTGMMGSHSKTMFEIGKTAAIAESIISTYRGMTKALELGWPLGPIAAGAIGAAGFSNVQQIRSQSFSRGGGSSSQASQGGPVGALPGTGGQQQQQGTGGGGTNTIINLQGDSFNREGVMNLLEEINEAQRDGGRITLA